MTSILETSKIIDSADDSFAYVYNSVYGTARSYACASNTGLMYESYGYSSITDEGAGRYRSYTVVSFSNTGYAVHFSSNTVSGSARNFASGGTVKDTNSSNNIITVSSTGTQLDKVDHFLYITYGVPA